LAGCRAFSLLTFLFDVVPLLYHRVPQAVAVIGLTGPAPDPVPTIADAISSTSAGAEFESRCADPAVNLAPVSARND